MPVAVLRPRKRTCVDGPLGAPKKVHPWRMMPSRQRRGILVAKEI